MNTRPKVLMFGWEFPPHNSGGLGVACYGLAKALAQQNTEITFVLPKKEAVSADFLKLVYANIPHASFTHVDALLAPYVTDESYKKLRSKTARGVYGWGLLEEVRRYALHAREIAEEEDFDVIHAHDWLSFLAGIEAKDVSGKPLVTHVHATEFDRTGGNGINDAVYAIEREGMHEADRVITVSQFTKNMAITHYGVDEQKIDVVHNGIDADEYHNVLQKKEILALKKAGNRIVLFLGRITLQKGPEYFLRAAKEVLRRVPNTYFIVAGSGDMEHRIIGEAASLGIGGKVRFAGFARGDDLSTLYRSADLYVLPSVSEPFGITPLEALLHGTPVLLSKSSGVREVLPHAPTVDFWDTEAMARKITEILTSETLRSELLAQSRRDAVNVTWKNAADKCLALYQNVLRNAAFQ